MKCIRGEISGGEFYTFEFGTSIQNSRGHVKQAVLYMNLELKTVENIN